jgi:hypothetical protein
MALLAPVSVSATARAPLWRLFVRKQGIRSALRGHEEGGEAAQTRKDDDFFDTGYYFTLAMICETTGRIDEAIELCRIAYKREPEKSRLRQFPWLFAGGSQPRIGLCS